MEEFTLDSGSVWAKPTVEPALRADKRGGGEGCQLGHLLVGKVTPSWISPQDLMTSFVCGMDQLGGGGREVAVKL